MCMETDSAQRPKIYLRSSKHSQKLIILHGQLLLLLLLCVMHEDDIILFSRIACTGIDDILYKIYITDLPEYNIILYMYIAPLSTRNKVSQLERNIKHQLRDITRDVNKNVIIIILALETQVGIINAQYVICIELIRIQIATICKNYLQDK